MQVYYSQDLREEELKNKVAQDWFEDFDTTQIIGNIDFCVIFERVVAGGVTDSLQMPMSRRTASESPAPQTTIDETSSSRQTSLLWAEAKTGIRHSLYHSLVQLILTIGRARTFDKHLPPLYLAAFDAAVITFLPYHTIQPVFYQNDFNWNVAPSNHNSKEFLQLLELVETTLKDNALVFNFAQDGSSLKEFIKKNLLIAQNTIQKIQINKNNFTFVYQRWCEEVKGSIQILWDGVIKAGLMDADFFLADLLSDNNTSILESLYVLLQSDHYQFDRKVDAMGIFSSKEVRFKDNMQAHCTFWNKYERPPKEIYWNYIVERRDLLVPQDIRERKGSFFTPKQWVELSQQYLAETLGENWQDEYYIWDCCAGTGNLLNGLTNKRNIWASTLDRADVDVMHERIKHGANLLDTHVFQFDFLNDELLPIEEQGESNHRLPVDLYEVITNPDKRKKLIIYINPPYAEAGNAKLPIGKGKSKAKVAADNAVYRKYKKLIGKASNELFAHFFIRIYKEIPGCLLAEFSKLKILQASNFSDFRSAFRSKLLKAFAVPAKTFDNVKGSFPIGFFIWSPEEHKNNDKEIIHIDLYDSNSQFIKQKEVYSPRDAEIKKINDWLLSYKKKETGLKELGILMTDSPDFQHNNHVSIVTEAGKGHLIYMPVNRDNLLVVSIYFAVRFCIKATWMNDRDLFLYPNNRWMIDNQFQFNCLVYTLFHNQNRIRDGKRVNDWIPYYEDEMDLKKGLRSYFMQEYIRDFLAGKVEVYDAGELFVGKDALPAFRNNEISLLRNNDTADDPSAPLVDARQTAGGDDRAPEISPQAQTVLDAGREIYRYYHKTWQERGGGSPDAGLYDIKEYFKGRSENGKMNNKSDDTTFNDLMENLHVAMQALAEAIEPKVYEYGFLK